MRKFILAAALAAFAVPALAADMAAKAPPIQPVPFTAGASGFFWGIGSYAGVAQSSVSGTNLFVTGLTSSNLTASGGGVSFSLGYLHGSTATLGFGNWWRLQNEVAYQNIAGGFSVPGNSASVASRWSDTVEFDIGADVVSYIMSALQSQATINFPTFTPMLPANIQAGIPKQYFGVIGRGFGIDGNFGAAHGVSVGFAPGIKTGFLYPTLGANGLPNGGGIDLWASVSWATKGNTLNNVFASGGAPLTISAAEQMGTTYLTGITIARGF
jgi:hypothetical protein